MSLGDVVNEFLDQHSFADTSTTEETDLASTSIGRQKVDDLDTSLQNLSSRRLVDEGRGLRVNGTHLDTLNGTTLVNGLTNDVHDTTERRGTNGNLDRSTCVDDLLATHKTLGTIHGNGTDRVLTKVSGNLEDKTTTLEVNHFEGVENGRQVLSLELNIDDSTDDSLY